MFSAELIRQRIEYVRKAGELFSNFADYEPVHLEGAIEGIKALRKVLFMTLENLQFVVLHIVGEGGYKNISDVEEALKTMHDIEVFPEPLCDDLALVLKYRQKLMRLPALPLDELVAYLKIIPQICQASYDFINEFLSYAAPGK